MKHVSGGGGGGGGDALGSKGNHGSIFSCQPQFGPGQQPGNDITVDLPQLGARLARGLWPIAKVGTQDLCPWPMRKKQGR